MKVIGTAGHVDHGKSTLVKALTGIDPDRLKEEKQRQMTIDLGFAWLETPDGGQVGIVDVPGHLDFIENMIAGVGGIDAVLLIVAGDEGVMPQTREHLAIISLLKVTKGIVVLTKVDKEESDWLDLVEIDLRSVLSHSTLNMAEIIRVSAISGEGIPLLKEKIFALVSGSSQEIEHGKPRLPVDRVFSIPGFGTVVTGTLTGGSLEVGTLVQVHGPEKAARIRGLQSHKHKETRAFHGSRTAINLSGIDVRDIQRGDVVSLPGAYLPTSRLDAQVEIIKSATTGIKHNDSLKVFLHTSQRIGRVRLLGKSRISPGESGFIQLELDRPVVTERGDRFIMRRTSPGETLGGGQVINPHPSGRYRLNDPMVLQALEKLQNFSGSNKIYQKMAGQQFLKKGNLLQIVGGDQEKILGDLKDLIQEKRVFHLNSDSDVDGIYIHDDDWRLLTEKVLSLLKDFHLKHPLRYGIPKEEVTGRIGIASQYAPDCLQNWLASGIVKTMNGLVASAEHQIQYSPAQQIRMREFLSQLDMDPVNTPTVKSAQDALSEELFQSLVDQEMIVRVSQDVIFSTQQYQVMLDHVLQVCQRGKIITVAEFRDHFHTSRKYSLAFLEYLDKKGITERYGEGRRLAGGISTY